MQHHAHIYADADTQQSSCYFKCVVMRHACVLVFVRLGCDH